MVQVHSNLRESRESPQGKGSSNKPPTDGEGGRQRSSTMPAGIDAQGALTCPLTHPGRSGRGSQAPPTGLGLQNHLPERVLCGPLCVITSRPAPDTGGTAGDPTPLRLLPPRVRRGTLSGMLQEAGEAGGGLIPGLTAALPGLSPTLTSRGAPPWPPRALVLRHGRGL